MEAVDLSQLVEISQGASVMALHISLLAAHSGNDKAEAAEDSYRILQRTIDQFDESFRLIGGDAFAVVADSVVTVAGRPLSIGHCYPSAHHAAFGESRAILEDLWFHLDRAGKEANLQKALKLNPEACRTLVLQNGMDFTLVSRRWGEAKSAISELLPLEWRNSFRPIPAQIERERVLLKSKIGQPTAGPVNLSDTEQRILSIVRRDDYVPSQSDMIAALEECEGVGNVSEGTTKSTLAGLVRHGLLESGPGGRGYRIGWLGRYIPVKD